MTKPCSGGNIFIGQPQKRKIERCWQYMLGWGCLRYIRRQNREIDHSVVVKAPWITALLSPLISVTFLAHCCKMSCRWDIKANTRKFCRCRILNLARIFSLVPSSHPLDMETCLGWKGDLNIGFKRIFGIKKGWQYSQTRHLAITAVKPLEYQDKKRARTEPQKPLFRGVPGVSQCVSLVRVCNNYQFPCRKKEIYLATHSLADRVKFVFSLIVLG